MRTQLNHLKVAPCPHCNADIKRLIQGRKHSNGQFNETIEYDCGYDVSWIPNFSREVVSNKCKRTKDHLALVEKNKKAAIKLENYIKKLDCGEEFREKVLSDTKYARGYYTGVYHEG